MPYKITKKKDGKRTVSGPGGVHAKSTTKKNAEAQVRLLNAVEHNPKFRKNMQRKGGNR